MKVAVLLMACVMLASVGAEAKMSGKKLRTYLQKKMYQGRNGDPTRPVMKLAAEDAIDVLKVRRECCGSVDTGWGTACRRLINAGNINTVRSTENIVSQFSVLITLKTSSRSHPLRTHTH